MADAIFVVGAIVAEDPFLYFLAWRTLLVLGAVVVVVIVVVVMKLLLLEFGCHTLHWRSTIGRIGSGWDTHEGGRRSYSKGVTWVMLGLGEMAGTG